MSMAGKVDFYVDRAGRCLDHVAWQRGQSPQSGPASEAAVRDALAGAVLPDGVSTEILAAPARRGLDRFHDLQMVAVGTEEFEAVEQRYKSGGPGVVRDVFDTMVDQITRRGGTSPFTVSQVSAGREYRDLHERLQSAGIKCSSAFDTASGGLGSKDFMDVYLADSWRMGWFHKAIGDGVAKDTRGKLRTRSGKRTRVTNVDLAGFGKKIITVRALVDCVCIFEQPLSAVLDGHGWAATGKNRKTLSAALRAALTRMQGI